MLQDLWQAFQRNTRDRALNQSLREVRTFVGQLQGMEAEDLALIVGATTLMRVKLEDHGMLPKGLFFDTVMPPAEQLGRYQMDLNKLAQDFKRSGQHIDAIAASVLSLSLRSLNVPELRPLGREMWAEMERGFAHAEEKMKLAEAEGDEPFPPRVWKQWNRVPYGLQPPKE